MRAQPNRQKLTQAVVERLRPPADGHLMVWDTGLPGFGIRISPLGRKTWIAMYRVAGGPEVMETIATMAILPSLAEARERARQSMITARSGVHPVKQRKAKLAAEQIATADAAYTLDKMIEDFIAKHHRTSRSSTVYEVRRLCKRAVPFIGSLPVKMISKSDILDMINRLSETRINQWRDHTGGSLSEAHGVLRHLRSCFRWALDMDLVERDPTQGVRDPLGKVKRERERVLSETEIKALWKVTEELGYPFGPLVKLLILTGARCREVGDLTWSELDLERRIWSLPGSRAKNHRPHDTHLSDLAMEVIKQIPRFADQRYVFSVSGTKPVQSYADVKIRIDKRLGEILGTVEPWVIHDIRRSAATHLADSERGLGIAPHVVDRILNHVSGGSLSAIARIYLRNEFAPERRAALDAWSRYVEQLVYPERTPTNVISLRG